MSAYVFVLIQVFTVVFIICFTSSYCTNITKLIVCPPPTKKASGTSSGYIQSFQNQRFAGLQIRRITEAQICRFSEPMAILGLFSVLGAFWSRALPKQWRVQKKQSFGAKTLKGTRTSKKTKVYLFFFVPSSLLAPKLWFFWHPPWFWQGFAP